MPNRSGLFILFGISGLVACGGPSEDNFSDPAGASGKAMAGGSGSGKGGSGGKDGGSGAGGTSGSSTGGTGGGSSGGTGGSTGGAGGSTGGTGGSTGGAGGSTGGTGAETGGTGASDTGGTTGTGGSTGGTGGETGGTGALGGMGAMAGSGTGGDGGTRAGSGGSGGSGGNAKCVEHARAYAEALEAARVCNADSGKDQCTKQVPSDLECGCSVFVNPDNEEAVAELERLLKEIPDECVAVCPAVFCLDPETASCVAGSGPNSDNGTCGPTLGPK